MEAVTNATIETYLPMMTRIGKAYARRHNVCEDEAEAEAWFALTFYFRASEEEGGLGSKWYKVYGEDAVADKILGSVISRMLRDYFNPRRRPQPDSTHFPDDVESSDTGSIAADLDGKWGMDGFELNKMYLEGVDIEELKAKKPDAYSAMRKSYLNACQRRYGLGD